MPASIIESPFTRRTKSAATDELLGQLDVLLDVLLGEQRAAGRDVADERQRLRRCPRAQAARRGGAGR